MTNVILHDMGAGANDSDGGPPASALLSAVYETPVGLSESLLG